jgi:outer membrane lipoprotein-sorting protein
MKCASSILLLLAILVLPSFAQEPPAKPQAKAPETAASETLPSIDQILDKHIESLGGKAALEKLTSMQMSGTFEIPAFGASGTVKGYAKAPNKNLSIADVPGYGLVQRGYDGKVAWEQDPMSGLREVSGAELSARKREADFYRDLHLKELYSKLTVKSKEKVGEKEAYLVEATPAEGSADKMYFDVKTGLLIRVDAERETAQGAALVETYFEDYRDVDGVKVPFTIRQVSPAFAMTIKIDEIKHNVEIDDAKFATPAAQ